MSTASLHQLSLSSLQGLAQACLHQRLTLPLTIADLTSYIPDGLLADTFKSLNHLNTQGFSLPQIGLLLETIAQERQLTLHNRPPPELVWTGPEAPGTASRDTRVVVQELFQKAQHSVLMATYAIDQNAKADALFQVLADRMDANPSLTVQFFVNLIRPHNNTDPESKFIKEFNERFRRNLWPPGQRLPQVFYDPRSLSTGSGSKACLHTKCVVVDETHVFITSANFTEAAHHRNIETGILLKDGAIAKALQQQFNSLVAHSKLRPLP